LFSHSVNSPQGEQKNPESPNTLEGPKVHDVSPSAGDGRLWADVVSRRQKGSMSFQKSVVAAVYVDQEIKKRRERSPIVTGLEPSTSETDADLFAASCGNDLHITPNIVSTKRPGVDINWTVWLAKFGKLISAVKRLADLVRHRCASLRLPLCDRSPLDFKYYLDKYIDPH
jgi:hypothetical protein